MSDLYSRLTPVEGDTAAPEEPLSAPKQEPMGVGAGLLNVAKKATADNLEMVNAGVRLFLNSVGSPMGVNGDIGGKLLPRGGPARAMGVNEQEIKNPSDPLTSALAPMTRGAVGMLTFPAPPGMGTGMGLAKTAVLGAGSGEFGEIGKWIFGPLGRMIGGEQGEKIGEAAGEVAGSAAGGYANVVRMNTLGKLVSEPVKAAWDAGKALRSTIAAKREGDTRDASVIFLDHYGDLKTKGESMLQARADNKVANILGRDPRHQLEIDDFNNALKKTEADSGIWSIGQRANNPTLTAMEASRRLSGDQAEGALALKEAQPRTIVDAYKRVVSKALPTNPRAMNESMELYRAGTLAQADQLAENAAIVRKSIPNFTSDDAAAAGAKLRGVFDQEKQALQSQFAERYNTLFNQANAPIDITPTLRDTADVLRPLLAKVDTDVVPKSVRQLHGLMKRTLAEEAAARESTQNLPFYMRPDPNAVAPRKGYSMREVDDLISALGQDAHAAAVAKDYDKMNALNRVGESLLTTVQRQVPADVWANYSKIRSDYRDTFVPRFKEGVAYNLDREATAANRGMEKVSDQKILSTYLDKGDLASRMNQFDKTFGGAAGGPIRKDAYDLLSQGLQDRYSKEVLANGFSMDKHNKFMSEYDSAIDRVPAVRDRLDEKATALDAIDNKRQALLDNYKKVLGFDTTQQIGPAQAQQLFAQTLADPLKMQKLLESGAANTPVKAQSLVKQALTFADPMSDGVYNPDKLMRLLTMGPQAAGDKTSLQMLFEKALGPVQGKMHMNNLEAIATLMKREAMTDPKYLRFESGQPEGPMKSATGSSMASLLSGARSYGAGYGGDLYFPLVTAGRFFNNKMQKATSAAMEEALYNPQRAEQIIELLKTNQGNPMSRAAAEGIWGTGKVAMALIKDLADHGMIREQVARGAAYGLQQSINDLEAPRESDAAISKRQEQLYRGLK